MTAFVSYSHMGFYSSLFSSLKSEQTLILHCSASLVKNQLPKNLPYFIAKLAMALDVWEDGDY